MGRILVAVVSMAAVVSVMVPALAEMAAIPSLSDDDFYADGRPVAEKVELGRLLFFDKVLSGNKNIACATCHHPVANSGDALSLPVGAGGVGLGEQRVPGDGALARVPRNAPALFNLGAREFTALFHDGRVAVDPAHPSGFVTPAGDDLPVGLDNALAAQAMFPVTSGTEMAGNPGENPLGDAAAIGPAGVWDGLAARLRAIPAYVEYFVAVFDDVDGAEGISFVHAANAIGAFEAVAFRADNAPYDRYLRGETDAMDPAARRGYELFAGSAGCMGCHSGPLLTDQSFHAIAMPQIGPGKGDGEGYEDFGRERVTGNPADRFKFRTPSLRNVALTGPWGHGGAYTSLEAVVRHHLDPVAALHAYDSSQAMLPSRPDLDAQDLLVQTNASLRDAIAGANGLAPLAMADDDVADIVAFLEALTDPASRDLNDLVPESVPSGLPVAD